MENKHSLKDPKKRKLKTRNVWIKDVSLNTDCSAQRSRSFLLPVKAQGQARGPREHGHIFLSRGSILIHRKIF